MEHENIVRYLGFEKAESSVNVFLEYVSGGSVASMIAKVGKFDEPMVRSLVVQILLGLEYLHERSIIHRDIKGANSKKFSIPILLSIFFKPFISLHSVILIQISNPLSFFFFLLGENTQPKNSVCLANILGNLSFGGRGWSCKNFRFWYFKTKW